MKRILSNIFKPLKYVASISSRVLFPTRNLSPRNRKILSISSISVILVFVPLIIFTLTHLGGVEAAWFNSNWSFRKSIEITAHTSLETNVYINLTGGNALDTSDTSRFQADCGDLRFTDANGNILPYFIVSGCGSSTTVVHVFFQSFPAGAQTIYYYYGNASAGNGFNGSDFSTEAASYTIGSLGSEEAGVAPVAYWKFDEGQGTTTIDSSSNKFIGTLNNFDSAPSTRSGWMKDDQCLAGKCLLFDGTNDYVSTPDNSKLDITNTITLSAWVRGSSFACESSRCTVINKGTWAPPTNYNLRITSSGFLQFVYHSASYQEYTASSNALSAGSWYHVAVSYTFGSASSMKMYVNGNLVTGSWTSGTGNNSVSANSTIASIGSIDGSHQSFIGQIDDVRVYSYIRTPAQVKADFNSRGGSGANVFGASDANKNLTNGLVGHWKMDETAWVNDCSSGVVADSSGNGYNGSACPISTGPTGGAPGKFGNAGSFDGSNDYISMGTTSNLALVNTSYTMGAWIKLSDTSATYPIFTRYNNSGFGAGYIMGITGTGNGTVGRIITQYATGAVSTQSVASTTTVSTDSWAHVAVTFDKTSNTIKTYINGVFTGSGTVQGSLSDSGQTFMIGGAPGCCFYGSGVFKGSIDDARIYTRALSPNEIAQLYDYKPGPVLYLNFEEGAGTSVKDRSANNNSAAWNGAQPYWSTGKFGKGGTCDGSSSYINTSTGLYTLNGASMELWFQYRGTGTGSSIFTGSYGGSGAQRAPSLYIGAGNVLFWEFANQTTKNTGVPIEVNKWYHVAFTYDSNFNVNVYLNGIKVDSAAASTPGGFYSQVHFCHYGNFGSNFFNGKIDEVRIYNYPISQSQVVADMNGNHPAPGSPVGSATGHWKFDEGYGTKANNSGNAGGNIPGTLTNMASPATAVSGWSQSGKYNKALRFDGSNDFVSIANNPQALRFTGDLSISAWINLTNTSSEHDIVSKKGAAGQYGYRLNTTTSGNVQFEISSNGSTVRAATSSAVLAVNKWYHVVGVYNPGNSITVYIDGKKDGQVTTSMPASINNSTANVNIGAENNGASNFFAGAIDDPKLYSGVLTSDQVRLDYNRGSSQVLGSLSDTSGLTGGSVASNSASAEYCVPGDTSTCSAPVGRWDFDEGSGATVNDKSGNANVGTWNGTLGSQWTRGKIGKAGSFNGSDNYVNVPASSSISTSNYTVQFWMYPNNNSDTSVIEDTLLKGTAGGGNPTNYQFVWRHTNSNFTKTCVHSTSGSYSAGGAQIVSSMPKNNWYFVTCTYDGTNLKAYLNGKLEATKAIGTPDLDASRPMYIGASENAQSPTGYFNGKLDQIKVFNYARTASQIAWDYNRGAPVGWWKFDECQGSSIHDSSGNNIHGSWSGAGGGTQTAVGTCTTSSTAWGNGVTGKFNSSLNFDGVDDGVLISNSTVLFDSTKPFTAGGWAYLSSIGAASNVYPTFFTFTTDQSTGFILFFLASNGIRFGSSSNFVYADTANHTASDFVGKWTHIMLVYDGVSRSSLSSYKLYVNGVSEPLVAHTIGTINNENAIGADPSDGDSYFPGKIDDVRIYNYALTKQQVQQVMNQGSAIRFGPSTGAP